MSTQRGNAARDRPQKYKNRSAFKNDLHDKSQKTKRINSTRVSDVCQRCKEIIEWKIKYKKYKPLTQPKTCVKCEQKRVKRAYHVMCDPCGQKLGVCTKCGQSKELIQAEPSETEQVRLDQEMKDLLKSLPERKRRTFLRFMNKSNEESCETPLKSKEDLMGKLNALKLEDDDFGDEFSEGSSEEEKDEEEEKD